MECILLDPTWLQQSSSTGHSGIEQVHVRMRGPSSIGVGKHCSIIYIQSQFYLPGVPGSSHMLPGDKFGAQKSSLQWSVLGSDLGQKLGRRLAERVKPSNPSNPSQRTCNRSQPATD